MIYRIKEMDKNKRITDFYSGKTIFLTGASGFLGSVILATLLYCIPDIKACYILLRPKLNVNPNERKYNLFRNKVYKLLFERNPSIINKVHVISGDIMQKSLGIDEEEEKKLIEEVSIVFHCAASISFLKNLRDLVKQNCFGTLNVVEFSKRIRKLEALVYCSTAFGNCNQYDVNEVVYRFPFKAETYLKALSDDTSDTFEKLVENCEPEFQNKYLFSKCLCENIIYDMAADLPVAIVRPSIIYAAANLPLKGYNNDDSGVMLMMNTLLKGLIRYYRGNADIDFHIVPVDLTANCHIVAGWAVGTKRMNSPLVVHSSLDPTIKLGTFIRTNFEVSKAYPVPYSFMSVEAHMIPNKYIFKLYQIYDHVIPSFFFDIYLKFMGKKTSLKKFYDSFSPLRISMEYFTLLNFNMQLETYKKLMEIMCPEDKELFPIDTSAVNFREICFYIPESGFSDTFDWTKDKLTVEERSKEMKRNERILNFIKYAELAILSFLLYWIISFFM